MLRGEHFERTTILMFKDQNSWIRDVKLSVIFKREHGTTQYNIDVSIKEKLRMRA